MATPQPFGREMTNREFFIQRWEQEYPAFVQVFKALPVNQLDYRPEPRSRSAGELMALLVGIEQAGKELCEKGEIHWEDPKGLGKPEEMIAAYERDHQALGERLRKLDDAAWNKGSQCWEQGMWRSKTLSAACSGSSCLTPCIIAANSAFTSGRWEARCRPFTGPRPTSPPVNVIQLGWVSNHALIGPRITF